MHRRAVRLGIVALLLFGGVGAGVVTRDLHRQLDALTRGGEDVSSRISALKTAAADAAATQDTYLAPGQSLDQAAVRVASLIQQVDAETATMRPELRSVDAAGQLQILNDNTLAFLRIDQRVRTSVRQGDTDQAAEGIYGDSRKALDVIRATLTALGAAESSAVASERAAIEQQIWTVLAALAAAWVLGLLVLARMPARDTHAATDAAIPAIVPEAPVAPAASPAEPEAATIDLAAAADLCSAIGRVTSAAAIPDMLARAASVLDASGIILWMGAGDELFAAASHGYDPRVISRLGPIHRDADNATADAWRTGEPRTVSGDMMSNGAIVSPMFGPDACVGVLAAEIRHGREDDPATRAVTAMIAAQLATVTGLPKPPTQAT